MYERITREEVEVVRTVLLDDFPADLAHLIDRMGVHDALEHVEPLILAPVLDEILGERGDLLWDNYVEQVFERLQAIREEVDDRMPNAGAITRKAATTPGPHPSPYTEVEG